MATGNTVDTGHLVGVIRTAGGRLLGKTVEVNRIIGTISTTSGKLSGQVNRYTGGDVDVYSGEYIVTPLPFNDQVLDTKDKLMADDVTVLAIPYYETSNPSGITIYIGGE